MERFVSRCSVERFWRVGGSGVDASVAMDEDGNFLIAWLYEGDIYAQRFTDQGATIGSSVLLVDSEPNLFNSETNLDVSICGSQGVVGYEQYTGNYPYYDSFIQQLHFGGGSTTPGVQRSLGATANGADAGPSVAMNESGEFVVAYIRDYDDSVRVRKFHPDGSSVWPSTIYLVPDAELLPPGFWNTVDTVQIDVGNLEAINSTPFVGPIDGLDTAGRGPSPILTDVSMHPASDHTDTVALSRTDGTIVSTRHDLNDKALLATINEWNGLLTDIVDDLDKFDGFMTAANKCSLQKL